MARIVFFSMLVGSAFAINCKITSQANRDGEDNCINVAAGACVYTSTACAAEFDQCATLSFNAVSSGLAMEVIQGVCSSAAMCAYLESQYTGMAEMQPVTNWQCSSCTADNCNPETMPSGPAGAGDICDESTWPDLDHNLVCSDCKVLVDNFDSTYGTCTVYCDTVVGPGTCVAAWEETGDSCTVQSVETCSSLIQSSDALCQCGGTVSSVGNSSGAESLASPFTALIAFLVASGFAFFS